MSDLINTGTVNGKPVTPDLLNSYINTFERDWADHEIKVIGTERGKALRALQELEITLYEAEALERRAKQKKQPLSLYIHTILKNELYNGETSTIE